MRVIPEILSVGSAMIVKCENEECQAVYNVDADLIKKKGSTVRCSKCRHIFEVYPPETKHPVVPEVADPKPLMAAPRTSENVINKIRYTPFKTKLIYFAAVIITFIGIIVIPIEAYRPWKELYQLIDNARNLIGGVQAAFEPAELNRMNQFALDTINGTGHISIKDDENRSYFYLSFNMLLMEGKILSEEKINAKLEEEELETIEGFEDFDYKLLRKTQFYWKMRFDRDPEVLRIFQKYKRALLRAKENIKATGFQLSEIYVMIDSGKKEGFFENNIGYVIDSIPWWGEGTFSGEPYEITDDIEFWRESALTGEGGYGNNPISDPESWYLPRFDEDEWGTWFSVWLTKETFGTFNIFSIDFNASRVKKLMLMVTLSVLGVILVLTIIIVLIASWLSALVTRPITELTKGAEEVALGNYDYVVPVFKQDEFGALTKQFNRMTRGQKERVNLEDTLKKFLGAALLDTARKTGIGLEGQVADCTVMFTDFGGFSTITQKMSAGEAVEALNTYFGALIPIVQKYGGFADKYIGDAIVAVFGAPILLEDHAKRAVLASIEMQHKMREINAQRRAERKPFFEMRIGLNSGEVIVGAIGCDAKLEYTSIGETTNLANRMEAACEIGHIAIAKETYMRIKSIFFPGINISATPDVVPVKGMGEVPVFRVYVNNLKITKDMEMKDNIQNFYVYEKVDRQLKQNPEDVPGVTFTSRAKFL